MTNHDGILRFVDPDAVALLARTKAPRKALFLDRDGIINVDHAYVHTQAQAQWMPGIFELVAAAHAAGYIPVVVTNQAGIARGFYDESAFLEFTRWLHAVFAEQGAALLATFFCPHHPQAGVGSYRRQCSCRKPEPGMILAAAEAFAIDLSSSILIGDTATDIAAGVAAGVGRNELVNDQSRKLSDLGELFVAGSLR